MLDAVRDQEAAQSSTLEGASNSWSMQRSRRVWGWIFLSPWIIGFLAFYLVPILASFAFTFFEFDLTSPEDARFIDIQNYVKAATDPDLRTALTVTLQYMLFALPISIIVPLFFATLLNSKNLWAKRFFRTLFYLPYMIPIVSGLYIYRGFLNSRSGWLNRFLEANLGIDGPAWLDSAEWVAPALLIISLWTYGNAMLTMLASMQTVPTELYEAARVDGATRPTLFRRITLPMISPVIFYNLILSLVGLFRFFELPYILSNGTGQPGNSMLFFNVLFYRETFSLQNMGYGATLAWILFIIAMTITIFLFITARYWVYYAGDND